MAKAEALFLRHSNKFLKEMREASTNNGEQPNVMEGQMLAIIYGACIIAESIRQDMDEQPEYSETVAKAQGKK